MRRYPPAAEQAKSLLFSASRRLDTEDPVRHVGDVLDASLRQPVGDPVYAHSKMVEPGFSETADSLAFLMDTAGPDAPPRERLDTAVGTMRRIVASNFGREALHWLDGRIEPVRGANNRANEWGAWFGGGFDHGGVMESLISYEWNPNLTDSLPSALYKISMTAMQTVPGLRPVLSTIRCGRSSGSQQMTFSVETPLPLANLKPLMDALGLEKQHAGLMSSTAFVLGARFTLPPQAALLTLRPIRHGVELRLDVDLDALPDAPSQFMELLRMQMAERPRSVQSLDRWLMALTPDGYAAAGNVTVLSVRVRPDMPARLALYLRPAALEGPPPIAAHGAEPGVAVVGSPAPAPNAPAAGAAYFNW